MTNHTHMNQTSPSTSGKRTIAVLFGGASSEYEVSLQSAAAVIDHIDPSAYDVILLGITRDGHWKRFSGTTDQIRSDTWENHSHPALISPDRLTHGLLEITPHGVKTTRLDAALPILHGICGEDGTVQGLLELAGIPCIGCGRLASALCMDKDAAHKLAASVGVRVPESVVLTHMGSAQWLTARTSHLQYPLFVKPVNAGSSFGITKVTDPEMLPDAAANAFAYDTSIIIEEGIEGFEVGCAILGTDHLLAGAIDEIELSDGFFDFTEKYNLHTSKIHMPARIDEVTARRIQETAKLLYRTMHCSGFARVDCFLTPEGEIVFNEINTIPGFTDHSRFPNMMKGAGLSFSELIHTMIEEVFRNE